MRRKKKSLPAAERDAARVKALRRELVEAIPPEAVTRFKFVAETSVNLTYTRRYGRAPGGQRRETAVPLRNGPTVTMVAALPAQGVEAVLELEGAVHTVSFAVYLEQVLGPGLQPGDVVGPDNLPVPKAAGLAALVEARGACTYPHARLILCPLNWRLASSNALAHGRRPHPRGPGERLANRTGLEYGRGYPKLV